MCGVRFSVSYFCLLEHLMSRLEKERKEMEITKRYLEDGKKAASAKEAHLLALERALASRQKPTNLVKKKTGTLKEWANFGTANKQIDGTNRTEHKHENENAGNYPYSTHAD